MKTDTLLFWTVFTIIFFINIITPIIALGLSEAYTSHENSLADATSPPDISISAWTISGINVLLVPFWTFGMPVYMNLFIMIPLRVLAWIILLRMIRGI